MRFVAQPTDSYIVVVRVRNAHNRYSPWINSASAACSGICAPPGSVPSVLAVHFGTYVKAYGSTPDGAEDYHVTYSDDGGAMSSLTAMGSRFGCQGIWSQLTALRMRSSLRMAATSTTFRSLARQHRWV